MSKRVEYVIDKLKFYGHDGKKLKALGFCASLDHAEYMANVIIEVLKVFS